MASISATAPEAADVGQVCRSVTSALLGDFVEFFADLPAAQVVEKGAAA